MYAINSTHFSKWFSINFVSLGYGVDGMERVVSHGDLCDKGNDDFTKEKEAVFQMEITDSSKEVKANEWALYPDLADEKAGFVCEKEGNQSIYC